MKKIIFLLIVFAFNSITIAAQSKKELKEEKASKEYEATKKLISSKIYVFNANWISTSRGVKIDIASGSNSLAIAQDSTKASMQFFGEVNSIQFNGNEGVEFNNIIKDYKVEFIDKKKKIVVSFTVKNKSENYNVSMTITRGGYTFVDLYSNVKRNVTYDGTVSVIKEE